MIFVAEQRCNFTFVYVVANVYLVCSKLQTWSIVLKVPVSMKHLVLSCTVLWTGICLMIQTLSIFVKYKPGYGAGFASLT